MAKHRSLKVVKLRKGKVPDDSVFIKTLVFALDQARQGNVTGYAMVFSVKSDEGTKKIEAAKAVDDDDRMELIGMMRRMEHNFIKREWGEE